MPTIFPSLSECCARTDHPLRAFSFLKPHSLMKLKTLKPRLRSAARQIGVKRTNATRDQRREAEKPWRKWYRTARWRKLREQVLKRDLYRCRQTNVMLTGRANAPDSPVVDHIIPHRGDPDLFWDIDNLQAVAKSWHDGEKQRQERAGLV